MSAQPPPYLQLRDLVKDFGTGSLAVDHVSLDITKGAPYLQRRRYVRQHYGV